MKSYKFAVLALFFGSTSFLYAEDAALAQCIKASPYECSILAKKECMNSLYGVQTSLPSVPERFKKQDEELAKRNRKARENIKKMEEFKRAERMRKK